MIILIQILIPYWKEKSPVTQRDEFSRNGFTVGYLIGEGYIKNINNSENIDDLNDTILNFFDQNSSIPEKVNPIMVI